MLEDLTVKNFALIDFVSVDFSNGFTVLSGETGAGKSILIGALSFLLGGKCDVHAIRNGAHETQVSGTFFVGNGNGENKNDEETLFSFLQKRGIEIEDERIIVRRTLKESGKSSSRIGNIPVTRSDLQTFSAFLVDIHGQHEHQSLMKIASHRKFLDARAGLTDEVANFTKSFLFLVSQKKLLDELNASADERKRKTEMQQFALKEIRDAKLQAGEDESLSEEEKKLSSYEKLFALIEEMSNALSSDGGIVSQIKQINKSFSNAKEFDATLLPLSERLESAFYEIADIADELDSYKNNLTFDPARFEEVQDRLSLIYRLKKKYASSASARVSDLLQYADELEHLLASNSAASLDKEKLESEVKKLEKSVYAFAKKISEKRKAASETMSREVESILHTLGMPRARFSVRIEEKPGNDDFQKCGPYGMDEIEFLISANQGSPLLPLTDIASGGELSRVMLALKTIFAESDQVNTLIFDEIDTGIGGEVAVAVGSHLKNLANKKQVLCITHLASIAVFADNQIKIEKKEEDEKTISTCREITDEERIAEIARMLSGETSEASLSHAKAMLEKYGGEKWQK